MFRLMKKVILALIAVLMTAPALTMGSEGSGEVIVYTSYPDDVISYIYVIPYRQEVTESGSDTKITYLKPPVFTNQILVSRNYKTVLCTKYTICD
ncbi:MAG: hypothetical protein AB1598_06180 [Thermodesulfobacteriota bacterium]